MKNLKAKIFTIVLAVLLCSSVFVIAAKAANPTEMLPNGNDTGIFPTFTYLELSPITIGVGQSALVVAWSDFIPPTGQGIYGDRWTFYVNVIKPDGTNDTLGPISSDPTGASIPTFYTPTEVGTYVFQAIFQRHVIDGGASRGEMAPEGVVYWPGSHNPNVNPIGDVFLSSMSPAVELTVGSTPLNGIPATPLPTTYWDRPVYGLSKGWGETIMGEWYGASELAQFGNGGKDNVYSSGPTSSHILWSRPFWDGGVAGGVAGLGKDGPDTSYYSGQSYESYGGPSIILNGKLYYKYGVNPVEGFYVYDLETGQLDYFRNTTGSAAGAGGGFSSVGSIPYGAPAFGQVLDYNSPNQSGTVGYYWVTSTGVTGNWDLYQDFTGNYICTIANTTWTVRNSAGTSVTEGATGTSSYGLDGSILRFNIVNLGTTAAPQMFLQCWNSSQAILAPAFESDMGYIPVWGSYPAITGVNYTLQVGVGSGSNAYWMWRPVLNNTYDGRLGLSINEPLTLGSLSPGVVSSSYIRQVIPENEIVGIYPGANNGTLVTPGTAWAISLKEGSIGQFLWSYNFTPPAGLGNAVDQAEQFSQHDTAYSGVNAQAGIFWYSCSMLSEWFVLSLSNGNLLWTSPQGPMEEMNGMGSVIVYDGQFIDCGGYGGVVRAYNDTTGAFLWNWTAPFYGVGSTYWQYTPTSYGALSGDGQLYLYSSEHSVSQPIRTDAKIWDVNATDGKLIWAETCWPSSSPILGDSILTVADCQDMSIYAFGKGASGTTVSVADNSATAGTNVMITGTVTDQSQAGRYDESGILTHPLKGTPAIGDAYMDEWMEYFYHNAAYPTNATGVPVTMYAVDPNGNLINVGQTTSDATGNFGFAWKLPDITGSYQIVASFPGSNAYYGSNSATYLVDNAPANVVTPSPAPVVNLAPTQMYVVVVGIAMIIAIAIATVVLSMVLKKRP